MGRAVTVVHIHKSDAYPTLVNAANTAVLFISQLFVYGAMSKVLNMRLAIAAALVKWRFFFLGFWHFAVNGRTKDFPPRTWGLPRNLSGK